MYHCKGRFSRLVELNSENDASLFFLLRENEDEYKQLVSDRDLPATYPEFLSTLKEWFSNGRLYQFLIYSTLGNKPVGTIFFYNLDPQDESIKLSVFFERESRRRLVVAESLMMAVAFAKNIIGVKNISFSVYEENEAMRRMARKLVPGGEPIIRSSAKKERNIVVYKMSCAVLDDILVKLARLHR